MILSTFFWIWLFILFCFILYRENFHFMGIKLLDFSLKTYHFKIYKYFPPGRPHKLLISLYFSMLGNYFKHKPFTHQDSVITCQCKRFIDIYTLKELLVLSTSFIKWSLPSNYTLISWSHMGKYIYTLSLLSHWSIGMILYKHHAVLIFAAV